MMINFYGKRKRSMMKIIAIAIVTAIVLTMPIVTLGQSSPPPTTDLTHVQPQFSLSASEIYHENERNPEATKKTTS
jgi:hypothetical protein